MAGTVEPLPEEPAQLPARGFGDGFAEVFGVDRLAGEPGPVVVDGLAEFFLAQQRPQHVQHQPAFGIGVAVEEVHLVHIDRPDNGPAVVDAARAGRAVAGVVLAEVILHVLPALVVVGGAAVLVLEPEVGEEGGEALVQPDVRPGARGQQVAPPLVGQLVGHQAFAAPVGGGVFGVQRIGEERGGADVLHPAPEELFHRGLGVLLVGIRDADVIVEEANHRRGELERPPHHLFRRARRDVVVHRQAVEGVLVVVELAHDQRNQIGAVRDVFPPVESCGRRPVPAGFHQLAIRNHHEFVGHRDDHLRGRLVVGEVVERNPVVVVLAFALRPELPGLVGVGFVGPAEVEAFAGPGAVADDQLEGLAFGVGSVERDHQLLVSSHELQRLPVRQRDPLEGQLGGVQLHALQAVVQRRQPQRHRGLDFFFLPVDAGDLHLDVLQVVGAAARPVQLGPRVAPGPAQLFGRPLTGILRPRPRAQADDGGSRRQQQQHANPEPSQRSLHLSFSQGKVWNCCKACDSTIAHKRGQLRRCAILPGRLK